LNYNTVSKTTIIDFHVAYISCVRIVLCTGCTSKITWSKRLRVSIAWWDIRFISP